VLSLVALEPNGLPRGFRARATIRRSSTPSS
jgi:hypothetical protein